MRAIFSRFPSGQERAGRPASRAALAALCVAVFAAACHKSEDPATDAVNHLARGARDRDASAILDLVAADFQAADGSRRPDLEPALRQFFAAWESLDVTVRDLKVERSEGAALARFRLDLSGRSRKIPGLEGLLPSSSSWQFETRLAPSNGRWRVTWASWSPAP